MVSRAFRRRSGEALASRMPAPATSQYPSTELSRRAQPATRLVVVSRFTALELELNLRADLNAARCVDRVRNEPAVRSYGAVGCIDPSDLASVERVVKIHVCSNAAPLS